jgi:DNA-binding transcriptional LysR family regulator
LADMKNSTAPFGDLGSARRMKRGLDYSYENDIVALRSALAVRRFMGFRRAAEALGIDQSSLSRRIQSLEGALGVSLFERDSGTLRTTEAGERFMHDVEAGLDVLQQAAARAGDAGRGVAGRLRLGHVWPIATGPLGHVLADYTRQSGDVAIELREAAPAALVRGLIDREVDLALIEADAAPNLVDHLVVGRWPWVLVSPADAPVEPQAVWKVLAGARLLFTPADDWPRLQRAIEAAEGPRIAPTVLKTSREGLLSLVAVGAGHCLAPEAMAAALPRRDLSFTRLPASVTPFALAAAWAPGNDNPALRRFVSRVRSALAPPRIAAAE